jgi:hypothetical protein
MMIRQRITDRPATLRDMIRRTATVRDVEELLRGYDALAAPWEPPARYADLAARAPGTSGAPASY